MEHAVKIVIEGNNYRLNNFVGITEGLTMDLNIKYSFIRPGGSLKVTDDIPTERCRITRMQTGSVFCSKRSRTGVRTLPDARPPGAPRHPRRGFMYNATFRHTSNTQPHPPSLSSAHDAREARSAAVPSWRGRHSRPPAGRIAHGGAFRSRTLWPRKSLQ